MQVPASRVPPPTGMIIASTPSSWSTISNPMVPCPLTTSGLSFLNEIKQISSKITAMNNVGFEKINMQSLYTQCEIKNALMLHRSSKKFRRQLLGYKTIQMVLYPSICRLNLLNEMERAIPEGTLPRTILKIALEIAVQPSGTAYPVTLGRQNHLQAITSS